MKDRTKSSTSDHVNPNTTPLPKPPEDLAHFLKGVRDDESDIIQIDSRLRYLKRQRRHQRVILTSLLTDFLSSLSTHDALRVAANLYWRYEAYASAVRRAYVKATGRSFHPREEASYYTCVDCQSQVRVSCKNWTEYNTVVRCTNFVCGECREDGNYTDEEIEEAIARTEYDWHLLRLRTMPYRNTLPKEGGGA